VDSLDEAKTGNIKVTVESNGLNKRKTPMNYKHYLILTLLIPTLSCKEGPTGPEMDCHLNDLYLLDYHFINAPKVFDVRTVPPKEIMNGTIEYDLFYQWFFHRDDDPAPIPYSNYFIDSITFLSPSSVEVHLFKSEVSTIYSYARNDCGLELTSPDGELHLELTQGGDEISEQRFAIYDHKSKRVTIDTLSFISDSFTFIEYRLGPFLSYEDIIKEFANDNPGLYDTVAVELVQNRTKE